ncbi:MAG: hypothetical protein F9K45_03260 [Melioribacteraceae bacterium]|nr:MAG: hypothetical protein F9K45_03260 [Melioribacteraceae bacterium]
MEENFNNDSLNNENEQHDDEELELTHTDKLVGVFAEPGTTFSKMSKWDPRHADWFIPVLLMIIVAVVSNFVMMTNPVIKHSVIEKQMAKMEEGFQKAIEEGKMTKEQAQAQMDGIRENMEKNMAVGQVFQVIGMLIFIFSSFFIIALVYWIAAKFILKGDGSYSSAMVALGLPYYISIIQIIVMVILALSMDKFFQGTSVAAFIDADTSTFTGFILSKLDIFSIWSYAVISIGLAKMFKSENTGKYYILVFGLWLGFGLVFFFAGKMFPFIRFFMP